MKGKPLRNGKTSTIISQPLSLVERKKERKKNMWMQGKHFIWLYTAYFIYLTEDVKSQKRKVEKREKYSF